MTTRMRAIQVAMFLVGVAATTSAQPAASVPSNDRALAKEPAVIVERLGAAMVRIDVPARWNGSLVIYCPGYAPKPIEYDREPASELLRVFLQRGFAVAQTGYSTGGWAIEQAVQDVDRLRAYFVEKFGAAREIYLTGHSLGGFVTLAVMESSPRTYDGGLAMCAPLAPASWFMARRVFDFRVAFDYYFPDLFPPIDSGKTSANVDPKAVAAAVAANPERAAALRQFGGLRSADEIPQLAFFFTAILAELHARTGGLAFDNRSTRYQGSPDDGALDAGVKRYRASAASAAYMRRYYTPSGQLARPMLALTTTYDPLIPAWISNYYASVVQGPDGATIFAQEFVERSGHCAITPVETDQAFGRLLEWRRTSVAPPGGLQSATAQRATARQ